MINLFHTVAEIVADLSCAMTAALGEDRMMWISPSHDRTVSDSVEFPGYAVRDGERRAGPAPSWSSRRPHGRLETAHRL